MFDDIKKGEKLKKNIKSKINKWLKNKISELGEIKAKSIKRKINKRLKNKMSELGRKISKARLIKDLKIKWVDWEKLKKSIKL